jgi:DNA (cytosine-5)-methyltransferase 1
VSVDWGEYEPAIRRWESITRPAPAPTEPNKNGKPRLTAAFDEWLMGLPKGWITDIDIPYGAQIKLCGNGVVPQQAEFALRTLLST